MKEPIPKIDLEMSDVADIQSLSEKELKLVPFDKRKWVCGVAGCSKYTSIKDYGISPQYNWRGIWVDISAEFFLCAIHFKQYKAAGKDSAIFDLKDKEQIKQSL
jgi:hypothetical protein